MKSICLLLAALTFATSVAAQPYPAKPIRLVTQGPPGSLSYNIVRKLGRAPSESMGYKRVLIDNKPGADSMIAAADVKKASPDGYTRLFVANSPWLRYRP